MRLPEDATCKVCRSVFCCAKCCYKHEIKNHAIVARKPIMINTNSIGISTTNNSKGVGNASNASSSLVKRGDNESNAVQEVSLPAGAYEEIYLFCPICEKRPLPLQNEIYAEMLIHLETHHLPLRCEKCAKMYYNISDLKEFTKCMQPLGVCQSMSSNTTSQTCYTDEASKVTVTRGDMHSTQVSPMRRQDFNDTHMTPISIINMRWKAKSSKAHEEFISDSVSSIKNISSISNNSSFPRGHCGVASAVKGKVIRSTSTPVHLEVVFAKPKEQTFNATGAGHMSSIYNSDSDISPALQQPSSQALEPLNRYRKVGNGRPRMSAVTPLRQVMSKSIQKAFAEHGLPAASTAVRGSSAAFQRKKMFDTTSSPGLDNGDATGDRPSSPSPPALDLRLSPAVRRSYSESEESLQLQISEEQKHMQRNDLPNMRRRILLSAQKLTTESIVITRTEHLSSVSSSSSGSSSNGSINSIKPHTSATTNASYQSAGSNSSNSSVFKSCRSVEIITSTTEQIQQIESVEGANCVRNPLPPITPITRIPGAVIHKKLIKFETPKLGSKDSRDSQNSPCDIFFTPNATPVSKTKVTPDNNGSSPETQRIRKRLVPQNLSGRFSSPRRPSIKECAHSTAFSRIENITDTFDGNAYNEIEDEVFVTEESQKPARKLEEAKSKQNHSHSGLWSIMSSVMRLPSRRGSNSKVSPKNASPLQTDANSNSIIKRCASIAGSLVRSKPLVDENEMNTLKRKRTFTTHEQSTSSYLSQLHNSDAASPPSSDGLNTSSKRFRIQGRRPIDRMRMNS
ncbi:mitosis initiation protein fs(1)Ya [Stomoxys calcitrans]|uniref:mitosis initiation protein fs(1)Ya n=1 Tax=Stomoxys calcitrans TaxID=35570 RepID=UPI0027E34066|nr:mitosis initiation protein fs(1)Ya [Stomoxys calcitrans]